MSQEDSTTPRPHKSIRRIGLSASYDDVHNRIELYFGEALVTTWPVPTDVGGAIEQFAWKRDQFVADRLRMLFDQSEVEE